METTKTVHAATTGASAACGLNVAARGLVTTDDRAGVTCKRCAWAIVKDAKRRALGMAVAR